MKPPIDATIRAARVAAFMVLFFVLFGAQSASAQPFSWTESYLDWPTVVPRGNGEAVVFFTGVIVTTDASLEEVKAAFPGEWMGKPRLRVGLGLRPPGLQLSFEYASVAGLFAIYGQPPQRLVFDPDLSSPVLVDQVRVNWYPAEGQPYLNNRSWFGPSSFFEIVVQDELMVTGEAIVNVMAIYAAPGDTVEVWGTEVGIPDLELRDTRRSGPVPVEPSTWGSIKASFR